MRPLWIILPLLTLALLITQVPNLRAQNGSSTKQPAEAQPAEAPGEAPAEAPAEAEADEPAAADDEIDMAKVSYALGWELGNRIRQDFARQDIDFDVDQIVTGIKDALVEEKGEASAEQMQQTLEAFKRHLDRRAARKNESYLAQNAKREGVKVTESGLQYEVLREGEGEKPAKTDTVVVHYRGTLVDGKQFDSSYERGQPATFPLDRVIDGWTEGLQLMPVGSKYRFVIPYELAYGEAGRPPVIPPKATLIFEVELLDIQE